jgi:ParB-like chromosome segregation protein Spo0J
MSAPFEFKFHPLADIFPMIEGSDLAALVTDIDARGLIEPIVLFEGMILDGRNRYEAAKRAKIKFTEQSFRQLSEGQDPKAYVISANIHRRHLNAEQKRDLLAQLIKASPEKSDRQIADVAKVDHKTVGAVREGLETTGEIPQSGSRKGKDGKTRKTKAKKAKPEKNEKPQRDMTKYKAFLDAVLDALATWPRDAEQAQEWDAYTREKLDAVMEEHWWSEPEEEVEEAA